VDLVYALGKKMIDDFNPDYHPAKTLSLKSTLQDADFIILSITSASRR
jgi:alpha-galactosidase/6-phospho-beta-glucosidase family protein